MFGSKKSKGKSKGSVLPLADGIELSTAGKRYNCNVLSVGGNSVQRELLKRKQIMSTDASFIVTDPAGELYRDMKDALEGSQNTQSDLRIFNLADPEKSDVHYNPFAHITCDADIYAITDVILANTSLDNNSVDPFFEKVERQLLSSILFLVYEFYPQEEQTLKTVSELIDDASTPGTYRVTQFDRTVERFEWQSEKSGKESTAVKLYKSLMHEPVETMKNEAIDLAMRLSALKLDNISQLTSSDDIDLYHFNDADKKNMLFVVKPVYDSKAGWIIPLLYTQLMRAVSYHMEKETAASRVIFFADTDDAVIPKLDIRTALMRQNHTSIVLESSCIERFKEQYPSTWYTISGNCNVKICHSRPTRETAEWMSKICGNGTLLTKEDVMNLEDGRCIIKTGRMVYDVKPAVIIADDYDWGREEEKGALVIPYDLKNQQGEDGVSILDLCREDPDRSLSFHKWIKGLGKTKGASLKELKALSEELEEDEEGGSEPATTEDTASDESTPQENIVTDEEKKAAVEQYDEKQEDMEKKTGYYGGSDFKAYTVNEALKIIKIKEERVKKLKKQISQGLMVYLPLGDASNAIPKDVGEAIISKDAADKERFRKSEEIEKKIFLISRENEAIADIKRQIRHFDAETVPEEQKVWNTTIEELKDELPALREQREFLQRLVSEAQEEQYIDKRSGSVYVKKPLYSIEKIEKDLYALEFKIAYMEESIEEAYTEEEAINIKGEIYI